MDTGACAMILARFGSKFAVWDLAIRVVILAIEDMVSISYSLNACAPAETVECITSKFPCDEKGCWHGEADNSRDERRSDGAGTACRGAACAPTGCDPH